MVSDIEALALVKNASRRGAYAAKCVEELAPQIVDVARAITSTLNSGGKVLCFGDGGSAEAAQHFAAEFTGKLQVHRRPLRVMALSADPDLLTAFSNDSGFDETFSRQVDAFCSLGDVVIGISTSGESQNVIQGIARGNELGALTIALTGPSDLSDADVSLRVGIRETPRVREAHDFLLHEVAQIAECFLENLPVDSSADVFEFVLQEGQLEAYSNWCSETNQTLVTTNGVFDLLHHGHRTSIAQARCLGDILVVCLNSDASTRRLKGLNRPIQSVDQRVLSLASLPSVDHVVVFEEETPSRALEKLRPQIHAKGGDYAGKPLAEEAVVKESGGSVEFLPLVPGISTSSFLGKR